MVRPAGAVPSQHEGRHDLRVVAAPNSVSSQASRFDQGEGRVGQLRVGIGFPGPEKLLPAAFAMLLQDAPRTKLIIN